jgi:hypothetical protein
MVSLKTREDCMLFLEKHFKLSFILMFLCNIGLSQKVTRIFYADSASLYRQPGTVFTNKDIPVEYKEAIQIALQFYPELSKINIKFRLRKRKSPLAARPSVWAIFKKVSKRKYIITISSFSNTRLTPILLMNLSFNSQVGVIGHELAHIDFYNSKRGIYFIGLALKHFSKRAIDNFEFDTDKKCIQHGLGFQLLSWSKEVREKLDLKQWGGSNSPKGKRERYMNPTTIVNYMNTLPMYILE